MKYKSEMAQKLKERIAILNKTSYVIKVIDSCETVEQLRNAFKWGRTVLYKHIRFKIDDKDTINAYKAQNKSEETTELIFNHYHKKFKEITLK